MQTNNYKKHLKKIHQLVSKVKESKGADSDSFEELINLMLPLIRKYEKKYKIVGYDEDDMIQEASIVCFKACLIFTSKKGSAFPSFFNLLLNNHLISLVRKQNSYKRLANLHISYLDNNNDNYLNIDSIKSLVAPDFTDDILLAIDIKRFIKAFVKCKDYYYWPHSCKNLSIRSSLYNLHNKNVIKEIIRRYING